MILLWIGLLLLFSDTHTRVSAELGTKCSVSDFTCHDGSECVHLAWRCDGTAECDDGSDELDCPSVTCTGNSFQCDNGHCITGDWRCDGSPDCRDESDEKPEICSTDSSSGNVCSNNEFQCDNGQCINKHWVCDEQDDCEDGSDEHCENTTCDGFKCQTGRCVPFNWKCDGTKDCEHGSDELDCTTNATCEDDSFTCANNECISVKWRCDKHEDCSDGSDEVGCEPGKEACSKDQFTCENGDCISDIWLCDGENDCKNGSDELNCNITDTATCEPQFFRCLTPLIEPECIHMSWRCDGDIDCVDGSDEEPCSDRTCEPDEMLCKDGRECIKKLLVCDQQYDCRDRSDEFNCTLPVPTCGDNEFDCYKNGSQCIERTKVCDGNKDCHNNADEAELNCPPQANNVCQKSDKGGCQQLCIVDTSNSAGRVCKCNPGYESIERSDTDCKDIDECQILGTCSQLCKNTIGSFKCECHPGYALQKGRFCKATIGHPLELLLSDSYDLRRYRLDSYQYSLLVDSNSNNFGGATTLDFDIREKTVYWRSVLGKRILSTKINSGTIKEIESDPESDPVGIAVDWVHHNLYVIDNARDVITVSKLNGDDKVTLVSGGIDDPKSLAVDPYEGWMYWADAGLSPKIEKCGMNGKHRKVIRGTNIVWPNGITIDYEAKRLYWVDAKLHSISSSDLNGGSHRVIHKSHEHLGHPSSITVFEDFLYWSDLIEDAVHKINKFGNGNVTTIAPHLKTPYDIRIYHAYRQPKAKKNVCDNNGKCSHLCLPTPILNDKKRKPECACPTGMQLEGLHNCVSSVTSVCGTGKFDCLKSGTECIDSKKVCDKAKDCSNGADEEETMCASHKTTVTASTNRKSSSSTTTTTTTISSTTESKFVNGTNLGHKDGEDDGENTGQVAVYVIAIVVAIAVLVIVAVALIVRRHKKKNVNSMNFDNPVYRKTTTDEQLIMDKESLSNRQESMLPLNDEPEIV